ncbi:heat shock factor protein 5 isoform X2 [Xiphophorus couchianus]|uniref:heat shock factor protein 5 isoform X2 n=1 Tax=Xiphophorus couchianus TaxID=32473 RepID=UPI0010160069|nr:heat shock factor protein 5 isoform X2 [Xiphophorus couchianus]
MMSVAFSEEALPLSIACSSYTNESMDDANNFNPGNINPNIFPAKLWRLVNNPADGAIRWDSRGQVIVIDQQLFETQILSPTSRTFNSTDTFKTTNFSSFVRQLNLYGFKKVDLPADHEEEAGNRLYHHFHNPNFQRSCPQLLENLVRLTVDNKAKLKAGQDISSRLPNPNRFQRLGFSTDGKDNVLKGRYFLPPRPSNQSPAHPYHPHKSQTMRPQSGTPVPPRYLRRVPGAEISPTTLPLVKDGPMPLRHPYTGGSSNSKTLHVQQGFLPRMSNRETHFNSFSPRNPQYQPGYYPTVCPCFHPNLVSPNITGLQFPPRRFYQAESPMTVFDPNRNLQTSESQEVKKPEVNLDVVFQIADEVMQTSPSACLVKVESAEKPVSVPQPSSDPRDALAYKNSRAPVVKKENEELVVSVPEQMAEDVIYEFDQDNDAELVNVEVSNSVQD